MRSLQIILVIFTSAILFSFEPAGPQPFPNLHGITLLNKELDIPKDIKGNYSLLGLAYSKKAEEDLLTWAEPIFNNYIYHNENSLFPDEKKDVNVYLIPMFTGAKAAVEQKAKKTMKAKIDQKFHDHILVYHGSNHEYKAKLGVKEKDVPYFFVLDREGNVVYKTTGAFNSKKLDAIDEIIYSD